MYTYKMIIHHSSYKESSLICILKCCMLKNLGLVCGFNQEIWGTRQWLEHCAPDRVDVGC